MDPLPYTLPDHILIDPDATEPAFMVWQPERPVIVLGQSNDPGSAVYGELAERDGIPVYKRRSGGQTVILTPLTLVISVRLRTERMEHPKVYFTRINDLIVKSLSNLGVTGLSERGISDIAIGDRKILGSSIYRKKDMVFYHAVLNVAESPEFIGRYLRHPVKEPEYRTGRRHEDFVTSIREAGFPLDPHRISQELNRILTEYL